ncbi:MAG: 6,7-dimethyl-8-ribityllumazine synthase [Endozoicomonadaceae bacterium]|nr:6,7-dimethyl-8-ribityllumazine synthase [Endozoicomonadaceae bacterium]
MKRIIGQLVANTAHYAIISTGWNALVVNALVEGACLGLTSHGIEENQITHITCPGALEIPLTAKNALSKGYYGAIITVGAIIRGETPHFDFVAQSAMSGLSQLMLEYNTPITMGILTADTVQQALDRAGLKHGNKGREAACVAIEMVDLLNKITIQ